MKCVYTSVSILLHFIGGFFFFLNLIKATSSACEANMQADAAL